MRVYANSYVAALLALALLVVTTAAFGIRRENEGPPSLTPKPPPPVAHPVDPTVPKAPKAVEESAVGVATFRYCKQTSIGNGSSLDFHCVQGNNESKVTCRPSPEFDSSTMIVYDPVAGDDQTLTVTPQGEDRRVRLGGCNVGGAMPVAGTRAMGEIR